MRLREEQLEAIQRARQQEFVAELKRTLKQDHGDRVGGLSDELLERRIWYGIERARGHGLTQPYTVSRFIRLMFVVSPRFDEYPPARAMLADTTRAEDDRIDRLMQRITAGQWLQARHTCPQTWGSAEE